MQRKDIRAVGDLAGEASTIVTTLVRGMHAGIAGRVFGSIGSPAAPTRLIHDGLTRTIYDGVDRGLRSATRAAGAVAAEIWGDDGDDALESRVAPAAVIACSGPSPAITWCGRTARQDEAGRGVYPLTPNTERR